jgi:hypothetical protein
VALTAAVEHDVVVPTIGRPSLDLLLGALDAQRGPRPGRIVLVDDRPPGATGEPLAGRVPPGLTSRTTVLQSGGRGPAAARNTGWAACAAPWIVFLDDDVVPGPDWSLDLAADLAGAAPSVAAVQGRIAVPLPAHRRPTDRERNVARLATASWITADLAVRRTMLVELGGFEERFRRAYREDTDLHLRAVARGHGFAMGQRRTTHPVGPAPWWVSVAAQRGNADDALLRARHGPEALGHGRRGRHQVVTAAGLVAVVAGLARRRGVALVAAGLWLAGTTELAWARIAPGPRRPQEAATMIATSMAIPPVACAQWLRGRWRWRHVDRVGLHPPGRGTSEEPDVDRDQLAWSAQPLVLP